MIGLVLVETGKGRGLILVAGEVDVEILDLDAVGFEAALLFFWPVDGEIGGEATGTIDHAKARSVVGVGIVMKNVADDAGEMRVAKISGDLAIGDDFAGRHCA